MGKPERKAQERKCSSSSYFLRCFGVSRKIHSDKPILDAGQEKKKKTTRTRWFSREAKLRLKNGEITSASIYESEKHKSIVEDEKQNIFRVIRHVTDRNNMTACGGYKAVEHESNEKDTNEERDINPDPLSSLGNNDTCREHLSTGGKLDPTKTVGSGSKSSRVRKRSRVGKFDPAIGISIIMLTLMIMLMWGRVCAILCTSIWCYILPRFKEAATAVAKRKRSGSGKTEGGLFPSDLDLNSVAYKKKVVLEGFLVRKRRVSL